MKIGLKFHDEFNENIFEIEFWEKPKIFVNAIF